MLGERAVFKMYIMDACPYCDKARDTILQEMQMSLHTINVTKEPHLREMIIEDTGHKTLPAIFVGDVFIGGCDDLIHSQKSGELELIALREENLILKEQLKNIKRSI